MKRACKSHLQKTKTEEERYEVCLSGLLRWAGVYFSYGFVRQVGGVGGRRVRDLSPPEQLRLLRRQTMRLLQLLPRKGKTSKKKNLKNCLAGIRTLESMTNTQKCGRKQICRNSFDRLLPASFVGHAKGRNVLCLIAKFTKREHNLFLPKMRRISARQLNHRNSKRKVCSTRKNKCFLWPYSTFQLSLYQ